MSGDRSFLLYYASVMLREAKARRGQNVQWMLAGAARARCEAFAIRPAQADLFTAPAVAKAGGGTTEMLPPPNVASPGERKVLDSLVVQFPARVAA